MVRNSSDDRFTQIRTSDSATERQRIDTQLPSRVHSPRSLKYEAKLRPFQKKRKFPQKTHRVLYFAAHELSHPAADASSTVCFVKPAKAREFSIRSTNSIYAIMCACDDFCQAHHEGIPARCGYATSSTGIMGSNHCAVERMSASLAIAIAPCTTTASPRVAGTMS
jgi:hypothetical protein